MVAPCSLARELKIHAPLLFHEPSPKSNQSLLSPWFLSEPCLCLRFSISGMRLSFISPKFRDSHVTDPHCSFQGGSLHISVVCQTCPRKVVKQRHSGSQFMTIQTRKLAPRLAVLSWLPAPMPGNSVALRYHLFLQPGDPQAMVSHLGFCPLHHLVPLS